MAQRRTYTADFYCYEEATDRRATSLRELLLRHRGGHAPAYSLDGDDSVLYQVRSITCNTAQNVFKAVFGKLRHGETPEQARADNDESEVELLPGHGLVEKSHFLFFADINLVVFQRNRNAGGRGHFQAYLNRPRYRDRVLVPVLTRDAYSRLLQGGPVKRIEMSLRKPAFALDEEDALLSDCVRTFNDSNATRLKLTLSAAIGETLLEQAKSAIITLSKHARTSIARATLVEDNDVIDLVADRVTRTFEVDLLPSGRPNAESMFAGLAGAKDACATSLAAYFGP